MLRGFGIAGLALAASIIAAAAQEMKSPRISSTQVDWDAAVLELAPIDALRPADVPAAMAELNRATGERFANIAASPVPVLLPFDTAAFLRHRSAAADAAGLATTDARLRQRTTSPASARSRSSIPAPPATTPWSWRAPRRCPNWRSATPNRSTSISEVRRWSMSLMSRSA